MKKYIFFLPISLLCGIVAKAQHEHMPKASSKKMQDTMSTKDDMMMDMPR